MRGSSESSDEIAVQSSDKMIIRSNFERRSPKFPVLTVLITQPIPAIATPMTLAATECGAVAT